MPTTPHRLTSQSPTEAWPLINDNFDKVVQDITDIGAAQTTIVLVTMVVAASSLASQTVVLASSEVVNTQPYIMRTLKPVTGISGITPRMDLYIDVDDSAGLKQHLWPFGLNNGSSLTAAQLKLLPSITTQANPYAASLAAFVIDIQTPQRFMCRTTSRR